MTWWKPNTWFRHEKRFDLSQERNAERAIQLKQARLTLRKLRMLAEAMDADKEAEASMYAQQLEDLGIRPPDRLSHVLALISRIERKLGDH